MSPELLKKIYLNRPTNENYIRQPLVILVFLLPFTWMTYKGTFGYICALIFIISIIHLIFYRKNNKHFFYQKYSFLVITSLCAIFLSVFITQLLRGQFYIHHYDGPIRLILGIPILLAIFRLKINFSKITSYALPLALLNIFIYALINPNKFYETRLTNNYLDPIIWGNFSIIIGFMCLASINKDDNSFFKLYKLLGLILGISMSILSQSRSGWIAGIFMALMWIFVNLNRLSFKKIVFLLILSLFLLAFLYNSDMPFRYRVDSIFIEISSWINESQPVSSAGIRLTMWKISFYLFKLSPWIGYGDFSSLPISNDLYIASFADLESINTILCCGPHNEIAARLLQYGLFGLAALSIAYLGPFYIFFINTKSGHVQSSAMGIILCTGMLVSGLTGEMLTLKAAYNFYAIYISGLLATSLWTNHGKK